MDVRLPLQPFPLPREHRWSRCPEALQARLAAVARGDTLEWPGTMEDRLPLHLRAIDPVTALPTRFLRVIAASEAEAAETWSAISRRLAAAGVRTPALLDTTFLDDGSLVLSYRWMKGRYPLQPNLDFGHLGRSVAALHVGLSSLDTPAMEAATRGRISRLSRSVGLCADAAPSPAKEMIRRFSELSDRMMMGAGPIHGDLNPANVLVADDAIGFLDFEDVHHVRVWRGMDLAKLIERLVVVRVSVLGAAWAEAATADLVHGYCDRSPFSLAEEGLGATLTEAMRWHLALSLLVLWEAGSAVDPRLTPEYAKLLDIAVLIEACAPLIRRIV